MRNILTFTYGKLFTTGNGGVVTMKSLITINLPDYKVQFVECLESTNPIPAGELVELR